MIMLRVSIMMPWVNIEFSKCGICRMKSNIFDK